MNSQIRGAAAAEAVAGGLGVADETTRHASELQRGEDLFGLFNVAAEISLAVDDQGRGGHVAEGVERAVVP